MLNNHILGVIDAKISLMYIHDYYYSYYDGISDETRGNAGTQEKQKESWLFFQKDGYNTSRVAEHLSTRRGKRGETEDRIVSINIYNHGGWGHSRLSDPLGIRPVFYLNSNAKLASGDGTKANPYILDVQE